LLSRMHVTPSSGGDCCAGRPRLNQSPVAKQAVCCGAVSWWSDDASTRRRIGTVFSAERVSRRLGLTRGRAIATSGSATRTAKRGASEKGGSASPMPAVTAASNEMASDAIAVTTLCAVRLRKETEILVRDTCWREPCCAKLPLPVFRLCTQNTGREVNKVNHLWSWIHSARSPLSRSPCILVPRGSGCMAVFLLYGWVNPSRF